MKASKSIVLLGCLSLIAGFVWWKRLHTGEDEGKDAAQSAQSQPTPPPALAGRKFRSEQHWIIDEIGRDILEMVLYAKDANAPVGNGLEFTSEIAPLAGGDISFSAKSAIGAVSAKVRPKLHLWAGGNYSQWAKAVLDQSKLGMPAQSTPPNSGLVKNLAFAPPAALVTESRRVSDGLSQHPLDPELHEEAALILGSFALREAAGEFADTRQILSRMTAHLALARALNEKQQLCGQVAEAIQLCLVDRETEALEKIAAFPTELSTWGSALKMRCTGDWRLLATPEKAGTLEQMEYARALVRSIGPNALAAFVEKAGALQRVEWGRLVMERGFSVAEGHQFAKESVGLEVQDLGDEWKAWSGKELGPGNLVNVGNEAATRCVVKAANGKQRLEILSWGDIAAFHQRHICQSASRSLHFIREQWGVEITANLPDHRFHCDIVTYRGR